MLDWQVSLRIDELFLIKYYFKGFGIIYESSENAAKHLAKHLADESINVVKYK